MIGGQAVIIGLIEFDITQRLSIRESNSTVEVSTQKMIGGQAVIIGLIEFDITQRLSIRESNSTVEVSTQKMIGGQAVIIGLIEFDITQRLSIRESNSTVEVSTQKMIGGQAVIIGLIEFDITQRLSIRESNSTVEVSTQKMIGGQAVIIGLIEFDITQRLSIRESNSTVEVSTQKMIGGQAVIIGLIEFDITQRLSIRESNSTVEVSTQKMIGGQAVIIGLILTKALSDSNYPCFQQKVSIYTLSAIYWHSLSVFVFLFMQCTVEAAAAFKTKVLTNVWPPFSADPYNNQTTASVATIEQTLDNKTIVCALKYEDAQRHTYQLREFPSAASANASDYIVTHQGKCGVCSTTQDLAVYLANPDLTEPVRKCGLRGIASSNWALNCIKKIGFSDGCSHIWLYNTINTKKNCFKVCIKAWLSGAPNNLPDGSLNPCLQCDEDQSGPVFKYFAGRTRRDSGIASAIHRPPSQVYNMTHCYY